MSAYNENIDNYIAKAAPFAQPILHHLRQIVHTACPQVEEAMKWSFPNFMYKGSILCSMAAFKQHCTFGFWQGSLLKDTHNVLEAAGERTSMGHFGPIKSLKNLPSDKIVISYIYQAMELIDAGAKVPKKKAAPVVLETPDYFLAELKKAPTAMTYFEKISPSQKKEYVQWITEAKTEATRTKRMNTAVEWLSEGKSRNWKYENC